MINVVGNENVLSNKPVSAKELWGVTSLARANPECDFNKDVKEIYDSILSTIMSRAMRGYGDYNLNEDNNPWCGHPSKTEALRKVADIFAEKHVLNVSWYWDKDNNYTCKAIHFDWENEGQGSLKSYTI